MKANRAVPCRRHPSRVMGWLRRLALAVCLMVPLPGWGQAAVEGPEGARDVIVVGGDHYHPPYEFLDDDGEPAGYNVELTQAIAEVMGIEVRIELKPWSEVRRGLEQGEIDILQGMSFSEARTEQFDFAPPHAIVHQSIFARRGAPVVEVEELLVRYVGLGKEDVHVAGHSSGNRVDGVFDGDATGLKQPGKLFDGVLGLRNGQAVAGDEHD